MRTTKSKNQNTQLPAQVAAESANMNVLPAICGVKATLHHIDGNVSEIMMTLPRYTGWAEFLEDGQNSIREYVYQLTRHWIQITHFFIETGTITTNGTIASCFLPRRFDIPLGKFYKPMAPGDWVSANQHPHHPKYNQKGSSKNLSTLIAIAGTRNDVVYHQIEPNTVLCGIPFESKSAYFEKGDTPIGYFLKNGTEYMVIYSYSVDERGSFE
ncbi:MULTISPECIES: hypothetical protein [unclassified Pedobacter]|uniref:hypothetical protein n=1 Tax=unclassified Pedobacter TaxID=2628915 RepID=UPI001D842142|nr:MULTISPECIES: hypothetical protein [unclassified Pedobacter]CAH0142148.1 hypothetical protein SRABI126_00318 [Pedobacter sp. Bi126]CAH0216278.1 hypothetical protein SRABI36_02363 [Pedobacter sp. Bi36]